MRLNKSQLLERRRNEQVTLDSQRKHRRSIRNFAKCTFHKNYDCLQFVLYEGWLKSFHPKQEYDKKIMKPGKMNTTIHC